MSILTDYKWTGRLKPFTHQEATAEFLSSRKKAFCFSEAGTGKTAAVIWAADYLMNLGKVRRVLVVCPLSIMKSAWQQDLFKFAMHRSVSVAYGSAPVRKKVVNSQAEFVIINFDGLASVMNEVMAGGFDLIVVDEANFVKNPATQRWKVLNKVAATAKGMWMLTGTPAAQSPLDAYGLAKLINPAGTPKYYGQFRDMVMYRITQFKWAPKPHAEALVHQMLQPAIRFERAQCLDLPDVTYVDRDAPLTPQQALYYKKLKLQMTFEAGDESVTAVNAAVNLNKLLQVASGAIYTNDGNTLEFDVSNRLNVVREVIEEASHKVLIFVPFTHTITLLQEYLEKHNISCAVINGPVSVNKRNEIIQDFQTKAEPRVLIIQPKAASHGLTLTAADTVIWYAPVTSVETYLQANARINRPGQKNAMCVVHIQGSDVERRLYTMLRNNINNHEKIVDLYRQEIEEAA
ncbi:HepA Superfamily II DNA/RNA helicases, SNF2 family [uncultured Caudovirales phage]|uniref:HepA Superfamily II DNA/RNA helicases, SNF2 family n=1 Tax=uncultured Caudovirales phage TaxID=2100421 RepID=A0A6J5RPQ8_9CAUD|nr:HepA Superfamily II DNA/RNA helicases, SNF2 family [uncultured Caudovirales phage]CAB4195621.1 HepA Superfamily II DNA/RNA helicases, SNF2 family [uncultured Caudovirales phage]CAB4204939.1 HepA Superfamily II DNA/RNA helicases, SNF2 family [uncultured Caudovirales phage]